MSKSKEQSALIGPYLIAPTASAITILCEMDKLQELQIRYSDGQMQQEITAENKICTMYGKTTYQYSARIEGLRVATRYSYDILCNQQRVSGGHFTTLQEKPQNIHILTISDTHLFNTAKDFSALTKTENPDFILHSGDISFGTGYQREQYLNNWFEKIPKLLTSLPIYYTPGNHDDGPFFKHFFSDPQKKYLHTGADGRVISFDYGFSHFIMIDSNPWGLFEMNAVDSGLQANKTTKEIINEVLAWVQADLTSPIAQAATWKIMVLHHPYTDSFTNKYIIPLAERYGVNLILSGHLHYYIKSISINPQIASRSVYICQGSAENAAAYLERHANERILTDFPEAVAKGKNNYGMLDINEDRLSYKLYGFTENGENHLVDSITLTHNNFSLKISEIIISDITVNNTVKIEALVKNIGDNLATIELQFKDNAQEHTIYLFGEGKKQRMFVLKPGEERHVSFCYELMSTGEHTLRIGDVVKTIPVAKVKPYTVEHMAVFLGEKEKSNHIAAGIEIKNNLAKDITAEIPLLIDNCIVQKKKVSLHDHEQKHIDFYHRFNRSGKHEINIADLPGKKIFIEGGLCIIPRIQDKSGNGHYALLQGQPRIKRSGSSVEIQFVNYGDYIEIPANKELLAENGFTGIVWANIKRLAYENEMGHNPLMVRGQSVGWGANYLMRMVVDRKGGLKWGACYDTTEYAWQGGEANVGKWTQYTMSFSKQNGGNSYRDGALVAHAAGIAANAKIRQFIKEPIFIGYSYIGHIIEAIKRPKYFTHLPGSVKQVRFYTTPLSTEENNEIYQHPQKIGPQKNHLAIWLDFNNIISYGTHITQWFRPINFYPDFAAQKDFWKIKSLSTKAEIPEHTHINTVLELSNDGVTSIDSYKFALKNGIDNISIVIPSTAQYFRIKTELIAKVDEEGVFIPKLQEYHLTFLQENKSSEIIFSTRADWEKGTFTGAIGFEPVDRLKEFPEYTDVIHG